MIFLTPEYEYWYAGVNNIRYDQKMTENCRKHVLFFSVKFENLPTWQIGSKIIIFYMVFYSWWSKNLIKMRKNWIQMRPDWAVEIANFPPSIARKFSNKYHNPGEADASEGDLICFLLFFRNVGNAWSHFLNIFKLYGCISIQY